jgi:hypothetical protein
MPLVTHKAFYRDLWVDLLYTVLFTMTVLLLAPQSLLHL